MNSLRISLTLGLSLCPSLLFAAAASVADGDVTRIEIKRGPESRWLSASEKPGEVSLSKTETAAGLWRFHAREGGRFALENLASGKRWLISGANGQVQLAKSDAALSSAWRVNWDEQGQARIMSSLPARAPAFLSVSSGHPALSPEARDANFILHKQKVPAPLLAHGDIISMKSLSAQSGRVWLDCNTASGKIGLLDNSSSSGTRWRVHDNQDGSYSLECLGYIPGNRWLRLEGITANLGHTTDRNHATRWAFEGESLQAVGIRNLSRDAKAVWLSAHPASGITTLSASPWNALSSKSWSVTLHSRSDPAVEGRWSGVEDLPVSAIHTHVLPNGKVLFWSRYFEQADYGSTLEAVPLGGDSTFLLDPETMALEAMPNSAVDTFCSGHSFLPDGRLLVTGGHITSNVGPKATQIFDYKTGSWSYSAAWDMNGGRWYPTNLTLSTGEVLTLSGDATSSEDVNRIPQVWSNEGGWRDLTNLASSCFNDTRGPCMPLYPWAHSAPNGKAFISGPGQVTGYIDTKGEGSWEVVAKTNRGYRGDYEATSIMYAPGKILIAGGVPSTDSVEVIDLNQEQPAWREVASMKNPRHRLMSTLLADGTVMVTGGLSRDSNWDDYSVYSAEIWNPETEAWTEGDHMRVPRLYHATTVLLPDGRVLTAGGGLGAGYNTHKNMAIYNPPYLYKGDRPRISAVRESLGYGEELVIKSPDAAGIGKMHLIKLSSDTHSFNSNQLIVPLSFKSRGDQLRTHLPSDPRIATPGHYLLFIVNGKGVPSIGRIVHLDRKTVHAG